MPQLLADNTISELGVVQGQELITLNLLDLQSEMYYRSVRMQWFGLQDLDVIIVTLFSRTVLHITLRGLVLNHIFMMVG